MAKRNSNAMKRYRKEQTALKHIPEAVQKEIRQDEQLKTKSSAPIGLKSVQLARCLNSECPFYQKRHRRYLWYSKTKVAKPSCPKCFSHKTEIVSETETKRLGV